MPPVLLIGGECEQDSHDGPCVVANLYRHGVPAMSQNNRHCLYGHPGQNDCSFLLRGFGVWQFKAYSIGSQRIAVAQIKIETSHRLSLHSNQKGGRR
jgi:hypothetical protein